MFLFIAQYFYILDRNIEFIKKTDFLANIGINHNCGTFKFLTKSNSRLSIYFLKLYYSNYI